MYSALQFVALHAFHHHRNHVVLEVCDLTIHSQISDYFYNVLHEHARGGHYQKLQLWITARFQITSTMSSGNRFWLLPDFRLPIYQCPLWAACDHTKISHYLYNVLKEQIVITARFQITSIMSSATRSWLQTDFRLLILAPGNSLL